MLLFSQDPLISKWPFENIFPGSMTVADGGKNVDIHVVVEGYNAKHAWFKSTNIIPSFTSTGSFEDLSGHGTHALGLIAKVAPMATFHIYNFAHGPRRGLIRALNIIREKSREAAERHHIVCLEVELGGEPVLLRMVQELTQEGVHVALPAGNAGMDTSSLFPVQRDFIIVGACDYNDKPSPRSNNQIKFYRASTYFMTDDNVTKKYDRQIRTIGSEAQKW